MRVSIFRCVKKYIPDLQISAKKTENEGKYLMEMREAFNIMQQNREKCLLKKVYNCFFSFRILDSNKCYLSGYK